MPGVFMCECWKAKAAGSKLWRSPSCAMPMGALPWRDQAYREKPEGITEIPIFLASAFFRDH
ncbi:MAG TPA: hypothetical protein VIS99_00680 [Terrimicrobiaceae bacterium]